jgi:hypothetical protein
VVAKYSGDIKIVVEKELGIYKDPPPTAKK